MKVDVLYTHPNSKKIFRLLKKIFTILEIQGEKMSQLSEAVDALQSRISEDVTHLLDLLSQANARAEAAVANDAADAATIEALRAENQAALDDATATVARITNIDPVADFPGVEPEPQPETVEPSEGN